MSVARRFAAALVVVGAGVLAYAVPASATNEDGYACVDGTANANLEFDLDWAKGTAEVSGRDGLPLCEGKDAELTLSIYDVPPTWDGSPFPGYPGKAWPQTALEHDGGTLSGDDTLKLAVTVPDCGNVQIDLYTGAPIDEVGEAGHPRDRILFGYIWSPGAKKNGEPVECEPEPEPTPATPSPSTSTPAPPVPAPTDGLAAPVPVVPPQAAPAPPVLAATGSDSTVPLLGLGIALLGAGIGLSLLGRRRTA